MSVYYEARGPMSNRTVSVTDAATKVTLSEGKEYMAIQNIGNTVCFIGGSTVASTDGYRIYPNGGYDFQKCQNRLFEFYVLCAAAGSTTLGVYEW